jgi:hypothetical protein
VSGIDDWYLSYAHRHELTPGFSSDDDKPDPFVLNEIPGREWTLPRRSRSSRSTRRTRRVPEARTPPPADGTGSWQSAARKWLAEFPHGTNRECLRALQTVGHSGASTQLIERLRRSMPKPTPATIRNQAKANTAGRQRASAAGTRRRSRSGTDHRRAAPPWHAAAVHWLRKHPGASNREWRAALEEAGLVGVTTVALSALRGQIKPVKRRSHHAGTNVRRRHPVPVIRPKYCEGCGLAVHDDGRCRC